MKSTCVPFTLRNGGAPAGAQTPRRFTNGTADVNDTVVGLTTDRGYTEHEMLDELGIIHMNGRVYDPTIGRFMSADPFIQAPYELQSHNRYAYVMNNPLLYTDPSGFNWFKKLFVAVVIIVATVYTMGAVAAWISPSLYGMAAAGAGGMMAGIAAVGGTLVGSIAMGAAGGFVAGFLGSALNGGSFKESLKAGVLGGVTGAAMGYVGYTWNVGTLGNYLGHAVVDCGSSMASGGGSEGCGRGATAGLFGSFVSTNTTNANGWNAYTRGMATTVTGGVTSRMMGGSFADGATTAAYGYLFNFVPHEGFWNGIKAGVESYASGIAEATSHSLALAGTYGETAKLQAQGYANTVADALLWAKDNPGLVNQVVYATTVSLSADEQTYVQAKIGARAAFGSAVTVATANFGLIFVPIAVYGNMLEAARNGQSYAQILRYGVTGK